MKPKHLLPATPPTFLSSPVGVFSQSLLLAIAIGVSSTEHAAAAADTFTSGTAWATGTNWSLGYSPTASDNVLISRTSTATLGINGSTLPAITVQDIGNTSTASIILENSSGTAGASALLTLNGGRGTGVPLISTTTNLFTIRNGTTNTLGLVLGASGEFSVGAGGLSISSNITETGGTQSITKTGTGTLTLGGTNAFGGGLTQSAGALRLANASGLGTGTYTVGTGATTGATGTLGAAALTIDSTANFTVANAISLPTPGAATTYTFLKDSASAAGGNILEFAGSIGGGNSNLTLYLNSDTSSDNTTRYRLSGNNTLAGTININRGVLEVNHASALGTAGVRLDSNVNTTIGNLSFQVSGTFGNAVTITSAGAYPIGVTAGNTAILTGTVTSSSAFQKADAGTLVLAANNTISGTLAVNVLGGTLQVGNGGTTGSLGATTGAITISGGATLGISRSNAISLTNNITGSGTLTKSAAGTATLSGTNTFSGGTTIGGGRIAISSAANIGAGDIAFSSVGTGLEISGTAVTLANNITLPTSGTGNITLLTANNSSTVINGNISGGGSGTVLFFQGGAQSQNTGALTLNGNNTLTGTINIQRGPLILGNANAAGSATILIDSNNAPAGALQFGNSFTLNNNITMQYFASTPSQRLGVGTGLSGVLGGVISSAGGAAGIDKVGSGTLTLTNTNTYTGQTVVSAGTLALSGSGSIATSPSIIVGASTTFDVSGVTGGFTLGSGQTLSGTGTVVGNLTVSGTLAPGNSPGDLTFNDNLGLGGSLNLEVTGITSGLFDRLMGDGSNTLTLGGVLNLNNTGYTATLGDEITVFSGWGSISGSFTSITGTDLGGGLTWDTGSLATLGKLTVIPEPATTLLGGVALLGLLRRRRGE
ncbi:MAG: autotransporter-associated beta strand repeat-containing protein [Verrucomicrobia bacterium]|nr:autotransporter-associated beta strand repeat-containing protein [Verrucomicrobiota bacterium]